MGGIGSGRYGTRPLVENTLKLDVLLLTRNGIRLGDGNVSWNRGGELLSSIAYRVGRVGSDPTLTLRYLAGPEKRPMRQMIHLQSTRPHLGGERWWFTCPLEGRRCRMLYFGDVVGFSGFAGRRALGLAYRSQCEHAGDRALRRAQKHLLRLGGEGCIADEIEGLPKPKWMRWKTFHRRMLAAQLADAESWAWAFERVGSTPHDR